MVLRVERANVDADAAREQGLAAGEYVRIGVEDTGPGIPPGLLSHVFAPFFTTKFDPVFALGAQTDVGIGWQVLIETSQRLLHRLMDAADELIGIFRLLERCISMRWSPR